MSFRLRPVVALTAAMAATILSSPVIAAQHGRTAHTHRPAPSPAGLSVEQAIASESRSGEHRGQDANRNPAAILAFAGFTPGSTIADVMGGSGYFSELIADIVGPSGSVIVTNPPGFHEAEKWVPVQAAHPNISLLVTDPRNFQFAPNSLDGMFFHMTYHDFYWQSERFSFPRMEPADMLRGWFRSVKPGGVVVVVDHVGPTGVGPDGDPRDVVERLHRINPAIVRRDFEAAGFVFDGSSDALANPADDHSLLVFNPAIRGHTDRFMMKFRKR